MNTQTLIHKRLRDSSCTLREKRGREKNNNIGKFLINRLMYWNERFLRRFRTGEIPSYNMGPAEKEA
jgi:hypothetical protein